MDRRTGGHDRSPIARYVELPPIPVELVSRGLDGVERGGQRIKNSGGPLDVGHADPTYRRGLMTPPLYVTLYVTLLFFGYTNCHMCPLHMANVAALKKSP